MLYTTGIRDKKLKQRIVILKVMENIHLGIEKFYLKVTETHSKIMTVPKYILFSESISFGLV